MPEYIQGQPLPITIKFPPAGKAEFYTGLSRNTLYRMWRAGLLQTTVVRPVGGRGRGQRVIFLKPLLQYLQEQREFAPDQSPSLPDNPDQKKP